MYGQKISDARGKHVNKLLVSMLVQLARPVRNSSIYRPNTPAIFTTTGVSDRSYLKMIFVVFLLSTISMSWWKSLVSGHIASQAKVWPVVHVFIWANGNNIWSFAVCALMSQEGSKVAVLLMTFGWWHSWLNGLTVNLHLI